MEAINKLSRLKTRADGLEGQIDFSDILAQHRQQCPDGEAALRSLRARSEAAPL
jgi:hypothetical protein